MTKRIAQKTGNGQNTIGAACYTGRTVGHGGGGTAGHTLKLTLPPVLMARLMLAAKHDGKPPAEWVLDEIAAGCAALEEAVETGAAQEARKAYCDQIKGLVPSDSMLRHNPAGKWETMRKNFAAKGNRDW